MAFDRQAAKEAGYSDEEIDAFLQANPAARKKEKAEPAEAVGAIPESTTIVPEVEGGITSPAGGATAALGVAPYLAPAAVGAAGLYGASLAKDAVNAFRENAAAKAAAEQGIQNRFDQRLAQQAGQAARPVAPTPAPTYNVPTAQTPNVATRPLGTPGPVAPELPPQAATAARGAQAAQTGGNWMAQALNMAKQYAPAMAKAGIGTAMMAPTSTGPAVPSVGRMRGMEINPLTGRPWTPDQIAQYENNYPMFDQQLAAPQMRR